MATGRMMREGETRLRSFVLGEVSCLDTVLCER